MSKILYSLPHPILPFLSISATCAVLLGLPSRASSTAILIFFGECSLCIRASTLHHKSSYEIASSFCESLKTGRDNFPRTVFLTLLSVDHVVGLYPNDNPCWRSLSDEMYLSRCWYHFGGLNLKTNTI